MRQAVDRFVKRHHLLKKNAVIVVGVSGGPDSMALLDYLQSVRTSWNLSLITASVDHGTRGAESAKDLLYVEKYCREHALVFEGTRIDVKAIQREHDLGFQAAARSGRYLFFAEMMRKHDADMLALAHHGDDQIETMLMRQVRGSFGLSRAGIPVRRPFANGEIIRPLLAVDKQQIEAYCRLNGIEPRRDPSNESDAYTRNRFRRTVLPFLKRENPNVHHRFQSESEILSDDQLFLEELAKDCLKDVESSKEKDYFAGSVTALSHVPIALQRRVIQLILNY
ncbi:MAG TPA: tRNA lysidine(34) synthetase TilS, partial [Bacillales bacterium]|nr:tRNA lysidine(34) synthetase TilS [Bacillales bacterium]